MQVREIVYMCLDLSKAATSDDSFFTEDHVLFLLKKYRGFLIKKERDKEKESADAGSEFEWQQVCLDLERVAAIDGEPCTGGYYLKSRQEVPKVLEGTQPRVYPTDFYQGINICYVPRERMRYVGTNKYLKNIIYASLGPDKHLYLNSGNPQYQYLEKLRVSAIFEDFEDAANYLCDGDGDTNGHSCDPMYAEFPIREYLVPPLIELVVKELTGAKYQPKDARNDAKDDLPQMAGNK